MTDTRVIRPIRVAAQRIEGIIAIGRRILIRRRACRSMFARRISGGPCGRTVEVRRRSISSIVRSPAGCGGALCAVVSAAGLLKAVGAEDASDGKVCETSSGTVPAGKSSANKSEADLAKFPERRIGAPNTIAAEKMPIRGRWGAASAAKCCDCLSLNVQFLIVFAIICRQSNAPPSPRSRAALITTRP